MQKITKFLCLWGMLFFGQTIAAQKTFYTSKPDSVYLLSYATNKDRGHNGLHFAYSPDGKNWLSIGNEHSFLKCDYGAWGSQKRMLSPWIAQGPDGMWHCVWSVNETHSVFAHAASPDLTTWRRQSYPSITGKGCINPVLSYDKETASFTLTYQSEGEFYQMTSKDCKQWTKPSLNPTKKTNVRQIVDLHPFGKINGQIQRVSWSVVDHLLKYYNHRQIIEQQNAEQVWIPALKDLKEVNAKLTLKSPLKSKSISPNLIGIFFEDINYAADGGIYAELIQNRDFEYAPEDTKNRWGWCHTYAWNLQGGNGRDTFFIATDNPIHENNKHYVILKTTQPDVALCNTGFDGIVVKKGDKYNFSLFARQLEGKTGRLKIRLVDQDGKCIVEKGISAPSSYKWEKIETTFIANSNADNATLQIIPTSAGSVALDMISLFPQKTFKGRKNGLRADLAQLLADMKPRFVRFPGGCVSHGDGIDNIYRWVNTIGPLEARKPMRNIWNYHQSMGLGFFEYFQFCEDIGAEPLPVLAAGVPCQNSATGGAGQQGGIPMEEMDEYIEEILALIEYANGDPKKSKWAKMRADAGHPKPFGLKYLGIGNEDLITDVFEERFKLIYNAVLKRYPEITIIGTVGPFCEGTDYEEGWNLATRLEVPIVDEHYYQSPGWFLNNQQFYDCYDRKKSKVYLGEYATHIHGRVSNISTALIDALHLTNVERNGDIVLMTSYAPLLAKEKHTQWNPDMIYFNNTEVKPTVEYFVQKLFGNNVGSEYLAAQIEGEDLMNHHIRKRIGYSIVRDEISNEVIVKLVNLLPSIINIDINLEALGEQITKAKRTILAGKDINDRHARPVEDFIEINGTRTQQALAPYSLTILRISQATSEKL